MKNGDHHHQQSNPPGMRSIEEFDFFNDKRTGPIETHTVPTSDAPLKEIIFPILQERPIPVISNPVLMFDTKLEYSDVGRNQNRLLITGDDRLMEALTEPERERERSEFLEVITMDPRGVEYTMRLKKWPAEMGGDAVVELGHEWFKLVSGNGLKKGDSVQGFGYRTNNNQFRLAIVIFKGS